MKRTIPLLISAIGGFVLIVAFFIPATEGWGEVTAVWFDILASIAFILGGGNLLKIHLKKISDQARGWGYSAVTLAAFLVTLAAGLFKIGAIPSPQQQYSGESFAALAVDQLPEALTFRVDGFVDELPTRADGTKIPASARRQISAAGGELVFRGWMRPNQESDLKGYKDDLAWQASVELLMKEAQPPEELRGKVQYYADLGRLSFTGFMSDDEKQMLAGISDDEVWQQAVSRLHGEATRRTQLGGVEVPPQIAPLGDLPDDVEYAGEDKQLSVEGPMSPAQRTKLADRFPVAKPLDETERVALRKQIESRGGELNAKQVEVFENFLKASWTADQLIAAVNGAGKGQPIPKTSVELYEEYRQAEQEGRLAELVLEKTKPAGEDVVLNESQVQAVRQFVAEKDMRQTTLVENLQAAGELTGGQAAAVGAFLDKQPSIGVRNRDLALVLRQEGALSDEQLEFLFADFRREFAWRQHVGRLFVMSNPEKYPWAGDFRAGGTLFNWLYEYAFKPLTATMFAMLAFYVASAAFRAFRAKNFAAILLLGTAFIILLGRTFAGVYLTAWIPDALSALRIDEMTIYIMRVFNTAGNRAIMIGIALGIASTSLKVLLGVDRSYLGSGE